MSLGTSVYSNSGGFVINITFRHVWKLGAKNLRSFLSGGEARASEQKNVLFTTRPVDGESFWTQLF